MAPDLPPVQDVVLPVDPSAEERALHAKLVASARAEIEAAVARGEDGQPIVLAAILRLRQAAADPALLDLADPPPSSKLAALRDLLEAAVEAGHRALVFSSFRRLLDKARVALRDAGLEPVQLDGRTPLRERARIVQRMSAPDGPAVCLMTYGAGGVGLNLTGADHVILFDPWWNPAVEGQAIDRAHRIGQVRPVLVQRLVTIGTIEDRIRALQEDKRKVFHAAMPGAGAAAAALALMETTSN